MAKINTKWTTHPRFRTKDLEAWYPSDGTDEAARIYDHSGNARDVNSGASPPVAQTDLAAIGGGKAFYFDGNDDPFTVTASMTWRHVFCIGSFEDAEFTGFQGLLSGTDNGNNPLLIGDDNTDEWFDNGFGPGYRKNDVNLGIANADAPMNGTFGIMELSFAAGSALAGISIGTDRAFGSARHWKGHFVEALVFSSVQDFHNRRAVYRYFAHKYHLWRELADSTKIFPFLNDKATPHASTPYAIQSPPLPNGKRKARVKGPRRNSWSMTYSARYQEEADAVRAFEDEHYPNTVFAVENNAFFPRREFKATLDVPVTYESKEISNRFDYRLAVTSEDETETEIAEV